LYNWYLPRDFGKPPGTLDMSVSIVALIIGITLIGTALVLSYFEVTKQKVQEPAAKRNVFRSFLGICGIACVAASTLLLLVYAAHGSVTDSFTLVSIKSGNTLSFCGIVLSLVGTSKFRWRTFLAGAALLFLWFGQGISL
jgi:hypothetical protein